MAGPALYLLGHVLFRLRMAGSLSWKRLAGAAACLAVGALGPFAPALVLAALLVAILVGVIVAEHVAAWRSSRRGEQSPMEALESTASRPAGARGPARARKISSLRVFRLRWADGRAGVSTIAGTSARVPSVQSLGGGSHLPPLTPISVLSVFRRGIAAISCRTIFSAALALPPSPCWRCRLPLWRSRRRPRRRSRTALRRRSWGTNRTDLASQVVTLINQYRAGKGLSQLAVSSPLTASSTWKSLHMAGYGYFAHDDPAPPVARSAYQRAKDCGLRGHWLGREHRLGLHDRAVGRERLARLAGPQGEHREPELHVDRCRRRRERGRPAVLDAELRQRRRPAAAAPARRRLRRRRRRHAEADDSPPG